MTLLDRLRECVIDDRDIEPVLSFAAGGNAQMLSDSKVEFRSNSTNEMFARVHFKSGRISSIELGAPLLSTKAQEALLERARTETSHTHGSIVVSRVVFSERPLNGIFMWNDSVRLSPCSKIAKIGKGLDCDSVNQGFTNQPTNEHLGPPFPLLLEVRVPRSPNPLLESNRKLRLLDTYQHLFTLLLSGHIRYAHWSSERVWTRLKPEGVMIENHLVHSGFSITEDGQQADFSVREYESAPIFNGDDYYERLWTWDSELLIPSSLADDLAIFHGLDPKISEYFRRACYWYATGIQFRSEQSIAVVAFSTAIECLLPRTKTESCKECGKPTGAGPTQLFNQHIKRYGTVIPALEKQRNLLYGVRSALVHGSHASRVDVDFFSTQRNRQDFLLLLQIVAQRSLLNWLRDKQRETWHLENTPT